VLIFCMILSLISMTYISIKNNTSYALDNGKDTNMTIIDQLHFGQNPSPKYINGSLIAGDANYPIQFSKQNGLNKFQGDLVLNNNTNNGRAAVDKFLIGKPWPGGVIPYKIDPAIPNATRIIAALEDWMAKTPIQFVQVTDQNAKDYPNYIIFKYDPTSCYSYAGMQGGPQEIHIADWCNQAAVTHETSHAVGLWHEMTRCDRNQYVHINDNNIPHADLRQFNPICLSNPQLEAQNPKSPISVGPYDYCSITHYGRYADSINGQPTIVPLHPTTGCKDIGKVTTLSPGDIHGVQYLYPNLNWQEQ